MKSGGLLSRGLDGAELRAQHVYHPPPGQSFVLGTRRRCWYSLREHLFFLVISLPIREALPLPIAFIHTFIQQIFIETSTTSAVVCFRPCVCRFLFFSSLSSSLLWASVDRMRSLCCFSFPQVSLGSPSFPPSPCFWLPLPRCGSLPFSPLGRIRPCVRLPSGYGRVCPSLCVSLSAGPRSSPPLQINKPSPPPLLSQGRGAGVTGGALLRQPPDPSWRGAGVSVCTRRPGSVHAPPGERSRRRRRCPPPAPAPARGLHAAHTWLGLACWSGRRAASGARTRGKEPSLCIFFFSSLHSLNSASWLLRPRIGV